MTKQRSKLVRNILGFALTAIFLYLAFRSTDAGQLWQSLLDADYLWLVALVPIGLLSNWLRAVRWKYLLTPVKRVTSVRNLFSAVMIGYFFNNLLPRAGEIARPYAIGQLEQVSTSAAFGSVVLERILDLVTFCFMLCAVLVVYPHAIDAFVEDVESVRVIFLLGSILSLAAFVTLFLCTESLFRLAKFLTSLVPHRLRAKADAIFEAFLSGVSAGKSREHHVVVGVLSLAIFGLYALVLYLAFFMFEPMTGIGLDFGSAVVLLTVSTVAFLFPAPGAMGTYHSFLTFTLVRLFGVDGVTALSYSIVTHEVGYIVNTVVGAGYLMRDHVRVPESTGSLDPTGRQRSEETNGEAH
jgi:uncharacterized protein (TIRG00374 family)